MAEPLTKAEARELAREVVQLVANKQSGMPDQDDELSIYGDELEEIVVLVLTQFGCVDG